MGGPSSAIYVPREASIMLSTIAALPYVAPPIRPLTSVLDMMIEAAKERSKRRELMRANEMINKLVSTGRNNQLAQHSNIRATLDELHKTLCTITSQIVEANSGGVLSSLSRVVLDQEAPVARMRQQIDDALDLFHLAASMDLLAMNTSNPPPTSLIVTTSNPGRPRVRHPFDSSRVPVCDRPPQEIVYSRVVEPSRNAPPSTQPERSLALPDIQRASPRRAPITTLTPPVPTPSEIAIACMNVESQRRSFRRNPSPARTLQLATALERQATLMKNVDRTREALEASQESVELYKTLAERRH
ncbi:hypothetical protein RSOLAG22IIIB_05324 [Rhizoctonia solani]|uniref:Uncharacterized protein n=1 Tax=Rhizoctonia solani TaxID=456999 RepID=A0A0K6G519_9AGAM|nr:hypothetical protein RSOLAG22IIIB_05324 [Rhizoctonia solani]